MKRFCVVILMLLISACATPDTGAIKKFAGGMDTVIAGVEASYTNVNALQTEKALIQSALNYAVWKRTSAEEAPTVILSSDTKPLLTKEMLDPRREVLGAFKTYAELLVALSDDALTEGLVKETEQVGTSLTALQNRVVPLFPSASAIDFKPISSTAATIFRIVIQAKAAQAIADVSPKVHPHLVTLVDLLKQDLDSTDEIAVEQVGQITNNLQNLLINTPVRRSLPTERFEAFRLYHGVNEDYSKRAKRNASLKQSLDAMVAAHASINAKDDAEQKRAVDKFLTTVGAVQDIITSFK